VHSPRSMLQPANSPSIRHFDHAQRTALQHYSSNPHKGLLYRYRHAVCLSVCLSVRPSLQ
jgi:hypothetical protein